MDCLISKSSPFEWWPNFSKFRFFNYHKCPLHMGSRSINQCMNHLLWLTCKW
jgi:hypothetical protein